MKENNTKENEESCLISVRKYCDVMLYLICYAMLCYVM